MYKIKFILEWLSHIYISFIFRRKKVYVVTGLRRSGNHAFINWISNALENKEDVQYDINGHLNLSSSNKILFFNEINWMGLIWFIRTARDIKPKINQANYIIISLEDYTPKDNDPFIPKEAIKIAIRRNTFNVIASRLKRSINQAKNGNDRGDMAISGDFISYLKWLSTHPKGWEVWNFDLWIKEDIRYRKKFLNKINLEHDYTPKISKQGNGSSFTNQDSMPNKEDLENRWKITGIPERVIELLEENEHILDSNEKDILNSLKENQI